jgi:uncharacterized glyoxalase superfamily protein PhnB
MLAVSDGNAVIKFYQAACGAELLWHLDAGGQVVAGLSIDGAKFFLAQEAPDYGTRSPSFAGFTTVSIELFVDDRVSVHKLWPQVPASEAPSLNMSTKQLAGQQSNQCCKAPWQTRLVTSGLLESSSTNNRARIPPPHVLQISSPTRPLASYGRHLLSIRKSVVPRGAPAALAGFSSDN